MKVQQIHNWELSPRQAIALQLRLAHRVVDEGNPIAVRLVAGADIAIDGDHGLGAVVLLSYPELRVVDAVTVRLSIPFPYIPGLLAFREVPILAEAFGRMNSTPDLLVVDGHGRSHMRRFGMACHLGLLLDVPTIGCAKSRLVGTHDDPPEQVGGRAEVLDSGEIVGLALRTRSKVSPVYVSVGHRIGLHEAAEWLLRLCHGYRLPEPIRLADRLAGGRAVLPSQRDLS